MATGPAEPFATDESHWEADAPALEPAGTSEPALLELDAEMAALAPRPKPWRVMHVMYAVGVAALALWAFVLVGAVLIFFGFLGLVAVACSAVFIVARRAMARQESLLWILTIASEKGIPLAPAVVAFADQFRGGSQRRIMDLGARLNWGTALPEALEAAPRVVARDAVLLSWVGKDTANMPPALRAAATVRSAQLPIWAAIAGRFAYIIVLLLVLQTISGFLFYFILPKLQAIFSDFAIPLPWITQTTLRVTNLLAANPILMVLVPLAEVGLLFFLPFSFIAWGNYDVPLFDRMLRRRHTALVLRSLALFVQAGKPIAQGLETLSSHYPTRWVRRRLSRAELDVRHGADWIEALLHQQLIRPADAEVLRAAAAAGNLAWALGELAESGERRLALRFQAVVQTLFPLVVLILGFVVFWMAVSYFAPLVVIISRLAANT